MTNTGTAALPLATMTAWLRATSMAARFAATNLVPGVGSVDADEVIAVARAARPAYAAGDRYAALVAVEGALYAARDTQSWTEAENFLAWFETFAV